MALQSGARFGSYEIVALIGAGGMGEVYRARDSRLDRDVAIKVLPSSVAADADRLARFEREAKTLASINHSNIAQVFGLEEGGGVSAIVMELVEGEDLSELISRGPIAVPDAVAMARQIAEALEAAHEQGIIHRDLKPANVKVRADGMVKVLDFGLAKAVESATSAPRAANAATITTPAMTHAGVVLGTAAYMSPEQAKGKVVDRRADIWAFGAVLFEMLTGTRAFPGEDVTDSVVSIMSREPDWAALPRDTPARVRVLLRRALEKDAKRRLRDIGEARVILDDVVSGRGDAEVAMASAPIANTPVWRRVIPVAATVVVMSAVGYVAWRSLPPPSIPVVRFSITMADEFQFTRTSSRMLDISRDGSQIVYLGDRQLFLRSLSTGESRPLTATAGLDPATPFFSPDAQWVGFFSVAQGALKRVAVGGGASVPICPLGTSIGQFQGAVWDGDDIYFARQGTGILRVSANGGEPAIVAAIKPNEFVYGPAMLPGSRAFLMAVTSDTALERWDRSEIVAYTPATGERKVVLKGGGAPHYVPSGHLIYASAGNLLAVPFDTAALEVHGGPVPVVENVRRVIDATSGAAQYAISDSGTIAYIPGTPVDARLSTLAIASIDNGKIQPLPFAPGRYTTPRVSPDGTRMSVTLGNDSGTSIWVGSLTPEPALRQLTFGPRDRGAIWAPDSRFVLFFSDRGAQSGLYRQPADGSRPPELVIAGATVVAVEAVHPDGTIVFAQGAETDLWSRAPGGASTLLVGDPGFHRFLTFSPDGRWFAYASRTGTKADILVEPFPPTGARYPLSADRGTGPRWSPTGNELFYEVNTGDSAFGSGRLMSVRVRTTPSFTFGSPSEVPIKPIVTGPFANYDVLPDGKRLLVVVPGRNAAGGRPPAEQIHVVVNWIEELKARAPVQ